MRVGHLFIQRAALGVQREEGLTVARERARALSAAASVGALTDALPSHLRLHVDEHDQVGLERLPHARGEHAPTPERDHAPAFGAREQPAHELLLLDPERGLAAALELLADRMSQARFQQLVAVERIHPERARELGGDGRLPCPHEADKDDGPRGGARYWRRHPIRSS